MLPRLTGRAECWTDHGMEIERPAPVGRLPAGRCCACPGGESRGSTSSSPISMTGCSVGHSTSSSIEKKKTRNESNVFKQGCADRLCRRGSAGREVRGMRRGRPASGGVQWRHRRSTGVRRRMPGDSMGRSGLGAAPPSIGEPQLGVPRRRMPGRPWARTIVRPGGCACLRREAGAAVSVPCQILMERFAPTFRGRDLCFSALRVAPDPTGIG